jgi:hypothetical protein
MISRTVTYFLTNSVQGLFAYTGFNPDGIIDISGLISRIVTYFLTNSVQGLFAYMGFNPDGIIDISGLVRFYEIQSVRNNRYIKKFVTETRIHSGLRFNLLIMIGRTRDRRAGLIPHLLTSGLITSLMMCLS